jgi:hypothetical protein
MKLSTLLLFAASSPLLLASTAHDDWERTYVRKELYPANVRSMSFLGGGLLDADHPFHVGLWSVGFGDAPPKAIYHEDEDGSNSQVEIQNLACTDKGVGTFGCGLSLPKDGACLLFVDVGSDQFADVDDDMGEMKIIGCPTSLELTR